MRGVRLANRRRDTGIDSGKRLRRLLVVVLVLLAVPSPALALPTIEDGDFRVDLPSDERAWCVIVPESLSRPEDCSGVNLADARQPIATASKDGGKVLAFAAVVGGDFEYVTITRGYDPGSELDKTRAQAFVRGARKQVAPSLKADPINTGDPWEERANGVQIIGFEVVTEAPPGIEQSSRIHSVGYAAMTSHGCYVIQLTGLPSRADAMKALGGQMLSTLHATPAMTSDDWAAKRAEAIGEVVGHALKTIFGLVAVVVVVVLVVRQRKKRPG
jgi:hypothetical protein